MAFTQEARRRGGKTRAAQLGPRASQFLLVGKKALNPKSGPRLPGNLKRGRRKRAAGFGGRQGEGWQGGMEGTKVELDRSAQNPLYSHVTLYDAAGKVKGWMDRTTRARHLDG